MKIKDRIRELLEDGAKSTAFIKKAIPDKNGRNLAATISNNPKLFLRLERGLVGLRNRDEHLVTGRRIVPDSMSLYKKVFNLLNHQDMHISDIQSILSNEKRVSIQATITMNPNTFLRLGNGFVGLVGRDEHLTKKYSRKKSISQELWRVLNRGPRTLNDICRLLPHRSKASIIVKLCNRPYFERIGRCLWQRKLE